MNTALAHHLVSKYTSLVAVDKTPVRAAGDRLASKHAASLAPYGQTGAAIVGFPPTATNAPGLRLTGFLMVLIALLVLAALPPRGGVRHGHAC